MEVPSIDGWHIGLILWAIAQTSALSFWLATLAAQVRYISIKTHELDVHGSSTVPVIESKQQELIRRINDLERKIEHLQCEK